MKRSTRKKEIKAKKQAKVRDVKSGFKRLEISGKVYQWRHHGYFIELRTPGKLSIKFLYPCWQVQGFNSREDWEKEHASCGWDDPCDAYLVTPQILKDYIEGKPHAA